MNFKAELKSKLEVEYKSYINEVMKKEKEEIINIECYEIIVKQTIINYITEQLNDEEKIIALLNTDNVLDEIYEKWLTSTNGFEENIKKLVEEIL